MNTAPLRIDRKLWSIGNAAVDALLDAPPRLELHTTPAEGPKGPTVAVSVGAGVGPDLDTRYGGATMAATMLVAVNLVTGLVRSSAVKPAHGFPASLMIDPAAPNDLPQTDEDGENVAAERKGVDLRSFLGVPMNGDRLALFAWLDRLVSNTVIVTTPHAGGRPSPASTPAEGHVPKIRLVHPAPSSAPADTIEVTADPLALTAMATGGGPFVVLGLDGSTRKVLTAVLPHPAPGGVRIDLTAFVASLAPSNHPSWVAVFNGETALAPYRISR